MIATLHASITVHYYVSKLEVIADIESTLTFVMWSSALIILYDRIHYSALQWVEERFIAQPRFQRKLSICAEGRSSKGVDVRRAD